MKKLVLLFITLALICSPVQAKKEKSYALSLKIFKELEKAQVLADEDNYEEAYESLKALLEKRSSDYEKAQIHNLMGAFYYKQNKYELALASFVKILDFSDNMPLTFYQQTLRTVTQLNMMQENFTQAKIHCEQLVAISEEPNQMDYTLLAQTNFKLDDWEGTKSAATSGRELASKIGEDTDENILILLNAAHYELGELTSMLGVLEELIALYPKKGYILYLASIYGQLERYDKQLVLMEALYDDSQLSDYNLIRNLATLYMSENIPYKAAIIVEKAINDGIVEPTQRDYELLAQAWRLAAEREKALVNLEQAARMSDNGRVYLQKAYLHFDLAQWQQASDSLSASFEKGLEPQYEGEAWLLLGMVRFNLKQFYDAISACEKAKEYEKSERHAKQWITYISNEIEKYKSMQVPVS